MVDGLPWPVVELIGAWPSDRSGPQRFAVRWGKEGERHEDSILPSTKAWKAAHW
jgi:hypothetical protein